MIRIGREEDMVALDAVVGNRLSLDDNSPQLESLRLRDKVDSIIEQWLVDLWLLLSGEELGSASPFVMERDGHALAMVCGDQLRLLGSKLSAFNAPRSVGIEMA